MVAAGRTGAWPARLYDEPVDRRRSALFVVLVASLIALLARPAAAAGPTNDPRSDEQWGLTDIKAPEAWARGRGAGVSIAVVSTGIAKHEDLEAKLGAGFSAGDGEPTSDTSGRGTHLAGIAGAATDNGKGIAGVARDARLLPYKAFEDEPADGNDLIEALVQAGRANPAVILVDVPDGYPGTLRQTLKGLGDGGISVVVGARADLELDDLPVLAVAATTRAGGLAGTGVGPRGVAAPGQGILSTGKAPLLPGAADTYELRSGTGQAAAHVAGALAILRGLRATAPQAADLLRSTARTSGNAGLGAGIIDVAAAVAAYQAPPPPPAATTTTTKAVAKPDPGKQAKPPVATIPAGQVVQTGPMFDGPPESGEPVEPGEGEEPVEPPGAEAFADSDGTGGGGGGLIGGRERPWGTLTVGFGLLFGVGTGLSVTFRRLADAPI